MPILVPGKDDDAIIAELKKIANNDLEKWIKDVYEEKVKGYDTYAPFATPGDINTVKQNAKVFFGYGDRLFSGTVVNAGTTIVTSGTTLKLKSIRQHMANGSTRRYIDNGKGLESIEDDIAWRASGSDTFWGTPKFFKQVPKKSLFLEEQYYAVLKPFYQYVRFANEYGSSTDEKTKQELIKKIGALFFESARKVQPYGKLPRYQAQDSHPVPGIPQITRINKDKIKVYWSGCKMHSYWVKIGYGKTPSVVWEKEKEVTGTSILVPAKGQELHVALAFARYKPMTNNAAVAAPSNDPDVNAKDWSYKVFPIGPATLEAEHVVTTDLFDIDHFRLQLDQQYPDITVFDLLQMLQDDQVDILRPTKISATITASTSLQGAIFALFNCAQRNAIFDKTAYDFVKWEHIDIPIPKPAVGGIAAAKSWQKFTFAEKALVIHRSRIFDITDQMKIYNIPSVVLDPEEYTRPGQYASVLGKRPNDPDFDVVDRAVERAKNKKYYDRLNSDSVLNKPWQQAKHHFKVHERGRGTFFADFIYLNNHRETQACKRLRATRRSLDLSRKMGIPVIPKQIIAPFPYVSNASSKRATTFGINNYDRMQSYPAVQELPKTFVPSAITSFTEKQASTAALLPLNKKLGKATFYNIRVNQGTPKELPHPGYPSRAKAIAWQMVESKTILPSTSGLAISAGAAVIDKPIVLEL